MNKFIHKPKESVVTSFLIKIRINFRKLTFHESYKLILLALHAVFIGPPRHQMRTSPHAVVIRAANSLFNWIINVLYKWLNLCLYMHDEISVYLRGLSLLTNVHFTRTKENKNNLSTPWKWWLG